MADIAVPDSHMGFEDAGAGDGLPVVLLHGSRWLHQSVRDERPLTSDTA